MKQFRTVVIFLILGMLLLTACNDNNDATTAPRPKPMEPTATKVSVVISATHTPDDSLKKSLSGGVPGTAPAEPQPTDTLDAGMKKDLTVGVTGGPMDTCAKQVLPEAGQGPSLVLLQDAFLQNTLGFRNLCLYNLPLGEAIKITLAGPTGNFSTSGKFRIDTAPQGNGGEDSPSLSITTEDLDIQPLKAVQMQPAPADPESMRNPWAARVNNIPVLSINLWWPAALAGGDWQVSLQSDSLSTQLPMRVEAYPAVTVRPTSGIQVFLHGKCGPFRRGESVFIEGNGQPANQQLLYGLYLRGPDNASLADQFRVETDETGSFQLAYTIPTHLQDGNYFLVSEAESFTESIAADLKPCISVFGE